MKVLEDCEYEHCNYSVVSCPEASLVGNHQLESHEPDVSNEQTEPLNTCDIIIKHETDKKHPEDSSNAVDLCDVMLKQNTITEMLVKQHPLSHLPSIHLSSKHKCFHKCFRLTVHEKSHKASQET